MDIQVSIVVPVYNEQDNVVILCSEIKNALKPTNMTYEVIFIDDGSTDKTVERLTDIQKNFHNETDQMGVMRIVKFKRNFGQTPAMQAGLDYSRGEIIVTLDGDLQNDPADIPMLIDYLDEGYDMVCGWRKDRKDKALTRVLPSKIANWIIGKVTKVPIKDNGCSLKAYRSSVIKSVRLYSDMHRFIPAMVSIYGARIAQVEVNHRPRIHGQAKYGLSRVWKVLIDMIVIQMLTHFQNKPVRWFGGVAIFYFIFGILFGTMSVFDFFERGGRQYIILATSSFLFMFTASSLVLWGIIGEYFITLKRRVLLKPDK